MRKYLFIIFAFALLINNANAISLDDANSTLTTYTSTTIETTYTLNTTDVFKEILIDYDVSKYPQVLIYNFIDSSNHKLTIVNTITKQNQIVGFTINRNYKAYFDYQLLNHTKLFSRQKTTTNEVNESNYYILDFDKFYGNMGTILTYNQLTCCEKNIMGIINKFSATIEKDYQFSPRTLTITNQSQYLHYSRIQIKYIDSEIDQQAFELDEKIDSLNFVFKFIFLIGKGLLSVGSFIGGASASDFIEYQKTVLFPLEILNTILNSIINIVSFVWKMGIIFFFSMLIMLSFIFAMITSHDIYEAIPKAITIIIKVLEVLIVKPITWIFEKLVKFWS